MYVGKKRRERMMYMGKKRRKRMMSVGSADANLLAN
jgi:hypothetical protein